MSALHLAVRTPEALLFDAEVLAVTAEDASGWFGVLPGRQDVLAVLPPGLLVFRDGEGEGYVALAGGLLDLRGGTCRVLAREALVERDLEAVAGRVEELLARRARTGERRRSTVEELAREAMRRLATEVAR